MAMSQGSGLQAYLLVRLKGVPISQPTVSKQVHYGVSEIENKTEAASQDLQFCIC